jgi:circadian clock protein KaiB
MTAPAKRLEALLARSRDGKYVLRLYAAGITRQSARAIENVKAICETYLKDRYELTIVDLYQQPEHAQEQQVIAAPTLVKSAPLPVRRLIGDLSDTHHVLLALGIDDDEGD